MSIEEIMNQAAALLREKKLNVQVLTAAAVIDSDEVTEDLVTGEVTPGPDGRLDPNPNLGMGSKPGICTIYVYEQPDNVPIPEGTLPQLVLDEVVVADFGWTEAQQIADYVLGQLGR